MKCYRCGEETPEPSPKCYRCGEETPEPSPSRRELAKQLEQLANANALQAGQIYENQNQLAATTDDLEEAHAEVERLFNQLAATDDDLEEAHAEVERLRAELRKYEPSDGMMYRLAEMQGMMQEAAALFENVAIDDGRATNWLDRFRQRGGPVSLALPDLEAEVLALHTVIDQGRRAIDRYIETAETDERGNIDEGANDDAFEALDEWRKRVLVQKARERVETDRDFIVGLNTTAATTIDRLKAEKAALERDLARARIANRCWSEAK